MQITFVFVEIFAQKSEIHATYNSAESIIKMRDTLHYIQSNVIQIIQLGKVLSKQYSKENCYTNHSTKRNTQSKKIIYKLFSKEIYLLRHPVMSNVSTNQPRVMSQPSSHE